MVKGKWIPRGIATLVLCGFSQIESAFPGQKNSNLIEGVNYTAIPNSSGELVGPVSHNDPLDLEGLLALIEKKDVRSVNELIPLLPQDLRDNYVTLYKSESLQGASPENPRIILYGKGSSLLLSFNGSPSQKRNNVIEAIQYREKDRSFEMRDIVFPGVRSPGQPVLVSEKNPRICLSCHGQDPRPNWEGYFLWPGALGSQEDKLTETERLHLTSFLRSRQKRFPYLALGKLENLTGDLRTRSPNSEEAGSPPNETMGQQIDALNAARVGRLILENPRGGAFRYAILGLLGCAYSENEGDPEGQTSEFANYEIFLTRFLPLERLREFEKRKSYLEVYRDTVARQSKHFRVRVGKIKALHGGRSDVLTPRTKQRWDQNKSDPEENLERSHFVSGMRHLFEVGAGMNISEWSTSFDRTSYSFNSGNGIPFNQHLWRTLLDPKEDGELIEAFLQRERGPYGAVLGGEACKKLAEKSRGELLRDSFIQSQTPSCYSEFSRPMDSNQLEAIQLGSRAVQPGNLSTSKLSEKR